MDAVNIQEVVEALEQGSIEELGLDFDTLHDRSVTLRERDPTTQFDADLSLSEVINSFF
ncbi:uncharacterized protein DNG_01810 [Cephalotrichum gorgonifer]|uniref:Uncharacterized protein n=1 Tax=Cephalotrichum gorgonifer TaxID=2041049 RepID=A0AAE8SSL4_9PEZI|nr:uncharacterized protein DNG_01810 [Cephalotrichum gorgonifer]